MNRQIFNPNKDTVYLIKIKSCSSPYYWYADSVNIEVECFKRKVDGIFEIIEEDVFNPHLHYLIFPFDAEIIKEYKATK